MINKSLIKMTLAKTSTGQLVDIKDVLSGRQDNCFCVSCNQPLVAKKGPVKSHHFAHDPTYKEFCSWAPETELHIKTKMFIHDTCSIDVPIGIEEPYVHSITYSDNTLETPVLDSRYVADVYAEHNGEALYFEIKVTHETDGEKAKYYKQARTNALEIDMSSFFKEHSHITAASIEKYLKDKILTHKWLSINPVGEVGRLFYEHYVTLMKRIKHEVTQHKDVLETLMTESQYANKKVEEANCELAAIQSDIAYLETNPMTKKAAAMQARADARENHTKRLKQTVLNSDKLLKVKHANLDEKFRNIDTVLQEYEKSKIASIDSKVKELERIASETWRSEFELEHKKLIALRQHEIATLVEKKKELERTITDMQLILSSIDKREDEIAALQKQLKTASSHYFAASKQIRILDDVLRPLARQFGQPWPIDTQCEEVLRAAGSSEIVNTIIKLNEKN